MDAISSLGGLASSVDLSTGRFAVLCLVVAVAAVIRGLTGFGFAILAVPLMGLVIEPAQAVVLAIILQMLIGPFGLRHSIGVIDRRSIGTIMIAACITTPIGLWLLASLPAEYARFAIAAIGLGCFFGFMGKRAETPNESMPMLLTVGATSGVLNGFAAMPGPPVVLHFVRDGVPPAVARGSMIAIFFATATMATLVAWWRGMIDRELIVLTLASFPLMVVGNAIGARFFGRVSDSVWRGAVIALLAVAAIGAMVRLFS